MASATVALSGNNLTLNVSMTFKPAFAGAKNIYLHDVDLSGASSGWQQLGAWTIPGASGTPAVISATPTSNSGSSQSFALQYSDSDGAVRLQQVWAYFSATLANPASQSCMLYYDVSTNRINLLNDTATGWLSATLGAATTLQNSQCALNVQATTVALNGNLLTLNLVMTFQPSFAGLKNIYLYATDVSGSSSGWLEQAHL